MPKKIPPLKLKKITSLFDFVDRAKNDMYYVKLLIRVAYCFGYKNQAPLFTDALKYLEQMAVRDGSCKIVCEEANYVMDNKMSLPELTSDILKDISDWQEANYVINNKMSLPKTREYGWYDDEEIEDEINTHIACGYTRDEAITYVLNNC